MSRVKFRIDDSSNAEATLDLWECDAESYVTFRDLEGRELVTDALVRFVTISVSDGDPLSIQLQADGLSRAAIFASESDSELFWTELQSRAAITRLPGEQRLFAISPLTHAASGISSLLPSAIGVLGRGLGSAFKNVQKYVIPDTLEADPTDELAVEADGFRLGNIARELSETELTPYSGDPATTRFSCVRLSGADMASIWVNRMCSGIPSVPNYLLLCKQWRTLTKSEWDHASSLRQFVCATDAALRESNLRPPFNRLAFDVLMSLFAFQFTGLVFQAGFVSFLELVIPILVKCDSGDNFEMQDGTINGFDETAAIVFWTFKGFACRFLALDAKSAVPDMRTLRRMLKSILEDMSPSTEKLLEAKGATELDFCQNDVNSLFTFARDTDSARLFLTALIASDSVPLFMQSTMCTLMVHLEKRLRPISDDDTLRRAYEALVIGIDVRLVLHNVENLMELSV